MTNKYVYDESDEIEILVVKHQAGEQTTEQAEPKPDDTSR